MILWGSDHCPIIADIAVYFIFLLRVYLFQVRKKMMNSDNTVAAPIDTVHREKGPRKTNLHSASKDT